MKTSLHDPEMIDEDAPSESTETPRSGEAFTGRTGDGKAGVTLSALGQAGVMRGVLDEDAAVGLSCHS